LSLAVLAVAHWALRRPKFAGALALLVMTTDLALANAGLVHTVPQTDFDAPSEAAHQIELAERDSPSGPFRIHRMVGWSPLGESSSGPSEQLRRLIVWSRGTLHPFSALPLGLEYSATTGTLELDDHAAFFHPQFISAPAEIASVLGIRPG